MYLLGFNSISVFDKVKNIKLFVDNCKNYTLWNRTLGDECPVFQPLVPPPRVRIRVSVEVRNTNRTSGSVPHAMSSDERSVGIRDSCRRSHGALPSGRWRFMRGSHRGWWWSTPPRWWHDTRGVRPSDGIVFYKVSSGTATGARIRISRARVDGVTIRRNQD
jgi:hypothetical protein